GQAARRGVGLHASGVRSRKQRLPQPVGGAVGGRREHLLHDGRGGLEGGRGVAHQQQRADARRAIGQGLEPALGGGCGVGGEPELEIKGDLRRRLQFGHGGQERRGGV